MPAKSFSPPACARTHMHAHCSTDVYTLANSGPSHTADKTCTKAPQQSDMKAAEADSKKKRLCIQLCRPSYTCARAISNTIFHTQRCAVQYRWKPPAPEPEAAKAGGCRHVSRNMGRHVCGHVSRCARDSMSTSVKKKWRCRHA